MKVLRLPLVLKEAPEQLDNGVHTNIQTIRPVASLKQNAIGATET